MTMSLLTLSRQYAAGKISQAHYRAHRKALIDQQVFKIEEHTVPCYSQKEDVTQGEAEFTRPVQGKPQSVNRNTEAGYVEVVSTVAETAPNELASSPDVTTFNMRSRMSRLSQPEVKTSKRTLSIKQLSRYSVIAVISLMLIGIIIVGYLSSRSEPAPVVKENPIVLKTNSLLANPDWQVEEVATYRKAIKAQVETIWPEQQTLLESVNLYLTVPTDGNGESLDNELLKLQADLEKLKRRD